MPCCIRYEVVESRDACVVRGVELLKRCTFRWWLLPILTSCGALHRSCATSSVSLSTHSTFTRGDVGAKSPMKTQVLVQLRSIHWQPPSSDASLCACLVGLRAEPGYGAMSGPVQPYITHCADIAEPWNDVRFGGAGCCLTLLLLLFPLLLTLHGFFIFANRCGPTSSCSASFSS